MILCVKLQKQQQDQNVEKNNENENEKVPRNQPELDDSARKFTNLLLLNINK